MSNEMKEVKVLLVEDNPTDAELAIRALKKSNLANKLVWVKDGASHNRPTAVIDDRLLWCNPNSQTPMAASRQ